MGRKPRSLNELEIDEIMNQPVVRTNPPEEVGVPISKPLVSGDKNEPIDSEPEIVIHPEPKTSFVEVNLSDDVIETLKDHGVYIPESKHDYSDTLRIKSLSGYIPKYATSGSAGLDLIADIAETKKIKPNGFEKIPTGICVGIPDGYVGLCCPRSGLAAKHGITVLNGPGVIDSDYTGEIFALLHNTSNNMYFINPGDKIMQLVVVPYVRWELEVVEDLGVTERGPNGFGSTGI